MALGICYCRVFGGGGLLWARYSCSRPIYGPTVIVWGGVDHHVRGTLVWSTGVPHLQEHASP